MRLQGLIIAASDQFSARNVRALSDKVREGALPIITVGLALQDHGIPSIVYDDRSAVASSVEYLLDSYGGPVAYLGRIQGSASGEERFAGYKGALARRGQALDRRLVWDFTYRYRAGFEGVRQALNDRIPFRSIQAGSDELALGAMAAIQAHGLRIPEEVALVGIGNIESSAYFNPPLTTHGAFPEAIASSVATMVTDFRQQKPVDAVTTFARPFIRRGSA
jgi:DNA-binding LacI/PurR family transcriptional regulator